VSSGATPLRHSETPRRIRIRRGVFLLQILSYQWLQKKVAAPCGGAEKARYNLGCSNKLTDLDKGTP
jgi:hypothetical protein